MHLFDFSIQLKSKITLLKLISIHSEYQSQAIKFFFLYTTDLISLLLDVCYIADHNQTKCVYSNKIKLFKQEQICRI